MAGFLKIGGVIWCLTVIGWWVAPIITFLVTKLFAYLSVDLEQKLNELKLCSIPDLKEKLTAVQKQRVVAAARKMGSESDLQTLDVAIRSALYDAEDVLDLVEYHRIEKKLAGDRSMWLQHLRKVIGTCVTHCKEWFGPSLAAARTRCNELWRGFFAPRATPEEQRQRSMWQQHLREAVDACIASCKGWFRRSLAAVRSICAQGLDHSDQQQLPTRMSVSRPDPEAPGNPQEQQTSPDLQAQGNPQQQQRSSHQQACQLPPDGSETSLNSILQRLHSCFFAVYNCCRSILSWVVGLIEFLRPYRDWSYEVIGIKHNKEYSIGLNSFQLIIHGKSLRKRMEDIDSTITASKRSPLLNEQSSSRTSSVQDKDEENRSNQKEIDDMHKNIPQPVIIGREEDLSHLSSKLRDRASYPVINIHGLPGSGKTTLARYVCDHEKKATDKYFDPIMFVQVSKTFRLRDIFIDMLMEIAGQVGESSIKDKSLETQQCGELKKKLEEKLKDKRFLLVLDDLWVIGNDENEEKQMDILLHALAGRDNGSKILVTAQKEDAALVLGACENISIRELEQDEYLSLFMHYGLQGAVEAHTREKLQSIGSRIAEKLHRLPLAAVTVAKRLRGKDIETWKRTANLDVLKDTMGALWWSYEQLSPEIRRCFEYCSTFPRGYTFNRHMLVCVWIAQGFVNTSNATEEPEDVGQSYCDELLTFSFFSATPFKGFFGIHDLLHEFVERVAGSDFFRIGVNGIDSRQGIPPEIRHLFIETYDMWKATTGKILELENLRTLIIDEHYRLDEHTTIDDVQQQGLVREKLIEGILEKMRKLRVLIISIKYRQNRVFLISESIGQMKHLRLFSFYPKFKFLNEMEFSKARPWPAKTKTNLILPSTVTQLYQMQIIEFFDGVNVSYPEDLANNLIHLRKVKVTPGLPNIGRLTSLQWMPCFIVKEEEGYELRQLRHLNKLRGRLEIHGLENVRSTDEALEANLASKTRLTTLALNFGRSNPDVEVDEVDVLEGLLPPKNMEGLLVCNYSGSRYPSWMLNQNADTPENLDGLLLHQCSQLADIPEGSDFFDGLRRLTVTGCNWNALPKPMKRLRSLKTLDILTCNEIELLPTLPRSLEKILIVGDEENKLWKSFQDETHPNRQTIEHVSCKEFFPPIHGYGGEPRKFRFHF